MHVYTTFYSAIFWYWINYIAFVLLFFGTYDICKMSSVVIDINQFFFQFYMVVMAPPKPSP